MLRDAQKKINKIIVCNLLMIKTVHIYQNSDFSLPVSSDECRFLLMLVKLLYLDTSAILASLTASLVFVEFLAVIIKSTLAKTK